MSFDKKKNLLLVLTALIVAFVRNNIQYDRLIWDSLWEFLGFWLIHYFGVAIVVIIAFACIKQMEGFFFGYRENQGITIDKALVYIPIVILISAVCIFVIAHLPLRDYTYDEY